MKTKTIIYPEKKRKFLIKFKSMTEILMSTQGAFFDGHGNLCVYKYGKVEQLAPSYFSYLGTIKEIDNGHGFPNFVIEAEYEDCFWPNIALRQIASGKLDKEDHEELAKHLVGAQKEEKNV